MALDSIKTKDDLKNILSLWQNSSDPDWVLEEVLNKIESYVADHNVENIYDTNHPFHRALTLAEFDNGYLLSQIVSEGFVTFALDMSKNLQKEFHCETTSEKATAHLVALNYVRILELQDRMNKYLSLGFLTGLQERKEERYEAELFNGKKVKRKTTISLKYLDILSKELENAERFYLSSLHFLRTIKQPSLQVNIKTGTTVIGHNQVVQTSNK